jgi:hypothetical protein
LQVIECALPCGSVLNGDAIGNAYFHDSWRAPIVVSTICTVHNVFGRIYLFFIVLLHRRGVQALMRNAVAAGRL